LPGIRAEIEHRISTIQNLEPEVCAFVPETLDVSRIRLDSTLVNPDLPLSGMIMGVKDIINVDSYGTKCGSDLPSALLGGKEASCVTKLKAAGAVVAGKTHTTEFAVSDPTPTRNPHKLDHTPGGSSSGSAAAVGAGFCDFALGTQTVGSVIRPAAYCGAVGFKPTNGRIATDGVFPYSKTADHLGVIAHDLQTTICVVKVILDEWQSQSNVGLRKMRLAIPDGPYMELASANCLKQFQSVVNKLSSAGCDVQNLQMFEDNETQIIALDRLTYAELYRVHAELYGDYKHLYKATTLAGLKIGKRIDNDELLELQKDALARRNSLEAIMRDENIDLWISPSAPDVAPLGLNSTGDYRMNSVWTHTGHPVVTLPSGKNPQGLPYGLQIVGRLHQDEFLLEAAQTIADIIG
jgi:Asp-tRNA(Asn)/Glu-tRNA(Gln) amidotransferase A subunit family amidase